MSGATQLAAKAIVPIAVVVGIALARRCLRPSVRLSEAQLFALDARFQRTQWVVGVSLIAVAVVFVWTAHHILVSLNRYLAASDGAETSLRLWPQTAIWWFFPGIWSARSFLGDNTAALVRVRAGRHREIVPALVGWTCGP
jgi:hypothetical protein